MARTTRQPGGNVGGCAPRRVRIPSSGSSSGAGSTRRTPKQPRGNSSVQADRLAGQWGGRVAQGYAPSAQ